MDYFNLPPRNTGSVRVYTSNCGVNLQGLQVWDKPKGATMIYMICVGGGGGGGGGFSRAAAADGGGGGSGACSGIARFVCPAILLPDTLYVQVGGGGQGGAPSAAGGNGINSYILTSKTAVLPNMVLYSGVNVPGGGGAGTATAGGPAGTVPTLAVVQPQNVWGQWAANVGIVGVIGGAHTGAAGGSVTAWAVIPLSPGAPGGGSTGVDFIGGNINTTAILDMGSQGYYIAAGGGVAAGGATGGGNGSNGVNRITPFFCSGGAGGGTFDAGQGGHGGAGGYGCGGGGGGAGVTGGRGGNGGSGVVIITTS